MLSIIKYGRLTSLFLDSNTNIEEIFNFIDNIVVNITLMKKILSKITLITSYEMRFNTSVLFTKTMVIIHISSNNNKYIITYFVYRLHEILSK